MGAQGGMKVKEERAFTEGYLASMEAQFDMDSKIIESVMVATGGRLPTDEERSKARECMEVRRRACLRCPEYDLAVWEDREVL